MKIVKLKLVVYTEE